MAVSCLHLQSFAKALARVMGNTGSGLSRSGSQGGLDDEDDVNDLEAFHTSEITVPDEVKPRGWFPSSWVRLL